MNTKDVIKAMLTENTGENMLDSGFESGRWWQKNANRDFESEDACKVEFGGLGHNQIRYEYSVSLYHWMNTYLVYSPGFQEEYEEFVKAQGEEDCYELAEDFLKELGYKTNTGNTYNENLALDQGFQFVIGGTEDGRFLMVVWVHNGADIRGGYTKGRVFKFKEGYPDFSALYNAKLGVGNDTWEYEEQGSSDPIVHGSLGVDDPLNTELTLKQGYKTEIRDKRLFLVSVDDPDDEYEVQAQCPWDCD